MVRTITLSVGDGLKDMSDTEIMTVLQDAIADANDSKRQEKEKEWRDKKDIEEIEEEILKNSSVYNNLTLMKSNED
jgi:hypothetical protein